MAQRSFLGGLRRRLSPHPTDMPRTAWQKLNRAKTDSGWPLLALNLSMSGLLTAIFISWALSAQLLSTLLWWLSFGFLLDFLRTGHVMVCVARGQAGQLAPDASGNSPGAGGH
ncbi:hypothetical protein ACWCQK_18975 [Streptomyces sp. NPDC002306]